MKNQNRRVVITGVGAITPSGNSVNEIWGNVKKGVSSIGDILHFPVKDFPIKSAGKVKDPPFENYFEDKKKLIKYSSRKTKLGVATASMAIKDSGLDLKKIEPEQIGISMGIENVGINFYDVFKFFPIYQNDYNLPLNYSECEEYTFADSLNDLQKKSYMLTSILSILFNIQGANKTVSTACASSAQAIGMAYRDIKMGHADIMVTGGSETIDNPYVFIGFHLLGAISKKLPDKASSPFDLNRDGFVLGEGSGTLILEEYSHAKDRNARCYAELVGCGCSSNAYRITDLPPDGSGAISAMQNAIKEAGIEPKDVDYINAHGTSTKVNDLIETVAIKKVFTDSAYKIPINSTKSIMGHLVAASGAVELIICLMTLKDNIIHPTINYSTPDPKCDLDYVTNKSREKNVNYALSNSFGFGGSNVSLLVRRL